MNTLTSTAEKMPSETHDVMLVYVATVFLHYHKAGSWSSKSVGASRLRRNKYLIAFTCASVLLAWLSPKQFAFAEHISVLSVFSSTCLLGYATTDSPFLLKPETVIFLKCLVAPGPAGMKNHYASLEFLVYTSSPLLAGELYDRKRVFFFFVTNPGVESPSVLYLKAPMLNEQNQ